MNKFASASPKSQGSGCQWWKKQNHVLIDVRTHRGLAARASVAIVQSELQRKWGKEVCSLSLLEFWMMPYIPPAAPATVMTVPSTICITDSSHCLCLLCVWITGAFKKHILLMRCVGQFREFAQDCQCKLITADCHCACNSGIESSCPWVSALT